MVTFTKAIAFFVACAAVSGLSCLALKLLVGVASFGFKHGRTGVAPNAIELHPILGFACLLGSLPSSPGSPSST
jgi:hypothetical protein